MHTKLTKHPKIKIYPKLDHPQLEEEKSKINRSDDNPQVRGQCFRYFRYKSLTIKHIEKDLEDNSSENYQEQHTCVETAFHQLPLDFPVVDKDSSKKIARLGQNYPNNIQDSQPGINNRWPYTRNNNLSEKCIEKLKGQKIQVYDQIMKYFQLLHKKKCKKYVLYIYGDKQTGKKTLVYQALSKCMFPHQIFYLNFSIPTQKFNQQTLSLYQKLKSSCHTQARSQKEIRNVLAVNNVQIFIYFLKKAHIYHEFKTFIKSSNLILILVNRTPLDNKQRSWIAQLSQTVYVTKNNKELFLGSLTDYFADFKARQTQLVFPKLLANYFTVKLYQQNCLQLGIIQKFADYVLNSHKEQEAKQFILNSQKVQEAKQMIKRQKKADITTIKVTRELIQSFRKSSQGNKCTVQLQQMSLHQKIALVSCYIYLTENEQISITIHQTQKLYKWMCVSLSIEAKNSKQFIRDVLHNLQTYRLIKVLCQNGKIKEKQVILNIDLSKIRQGLSREAFLSKFLQGKSK